MKLAARYMMMIVGVAGFSFAAGCKKKPAVHKVTLNAFPASAQIRLAAVSDHSSKENDRVEGEKNWQEFKAGEHQLPAGSYYYSIEIPGKDTVRTKQGLLAVNRDTSVTLK